jgi:hypothetical protein
METILIRWIDYSSLLIWLSCPKSGGKSGSVREKPHSESILIITMILIIINMIGESRTRS